jgi:sn-glycerol 3-phosphate transport system ATP-binding protein
MGVRPEHVRLAQEGHAARVESVEYLGADSIVACRFGTEIVTARLPGQVSLGRGSEAKLAWDAEAVHLFDATSGLRVERGAARAPLAA